MGRKTKGQGATPGLASSTLSPGVLEGALRLEELAEHLDKVWAAESEEKGLPPALVGRVQHASGLFDELTPGDWVVVVFDSLERQTVEGPFVGLEDALDFAVRELSVGSLSRLVDADAYTGRQGLDEDDASDALLESFVSDGYDPRGDLDATWLELHEDDRLSAIRLFHRRSDGKHPPRGDTWAHAVVHMFAESARITGREPACLEAYAAWREAGLSRHEALHALGECIAAQFRDAATGEPEELADYLAAVDVERYRGTAPD